MNAGIDLAGVRSLVRVTRRHLDVRFIEFAMATGAGFLLNLVILSLGVIAVFHSSIVSLARNPSPAILGLDVLALGAGDTLAFIINEQLTVRGRVEGKGTVNWLTRWGKYQLTAWMGNMIIALVQVSLLLAFALAPASGSILGAAAAYPITYMVSMRFVWKLRAIGGWQPLLVQEKAPRPLPLTRRESLGAAGSKRTHAPGKVEEPELVRIPSRRSRKKSARGA